MVSLISDGTRGASDEISYRPPMIIKQPHLLSPPRKRRLRKVSPRIQLKKDSPTNALATEDYLERTIGWKGWRHSARRENRRSMENRYRYPLDFISYLLEPGPSQPNIIPKHVAPSYQTLLSELRVNHFGYRRSRLLTEFVGARGGGRSVTELTYSDPRQVIMHHTSRCSTRRWE